MIKKLGNKSVLVVDDNPGMLRALEKVLAGEGAVVICAEWAGDAMDAINNMQGKLEQIDLVITDLRMPFVTGLTLVSAISHIFPSVPIIVLTAFGTSDVEAECRRMGVAAFLEKPLNTAALLEVIKDILAPVKQSSARPTRMARAEAEFFTGKMENKNRAGR